MFRFLMKSVLSFAKIRSLLSLLIFYAQDKISHCKTPLLDTCGKNTLIPVFYFVFVFLTSGFFFCVQVCVCLIKITKSINLGQSSQDSFLWLLKLNDVKYSIQVNKRNGSDKSITSTEISPQFNRSVMFNMKQLVMFIICERLRGGSTIFVGQTWIMLDYISLLCFSYPGVKNRCKLSLTNGVTVILGNIFVFMFMLFLMFVIYLFLWLFILNGVQPFQGECCVWTISNFQISTLLTRTPLYSSIEMRYEAFGQELQSSLDKKPVHL